jgi:chlorite dismutase
VSAARQARQINESIVYMMISVFRASGPVPHGDLAVKEAVSAWDGVSVRGWYDVSGLRGDADVMVWAHARTSDELQDSYHAFRRSDVGRSLEPVWSQMALHRPAEFNKSHVPAFLMGEDPKSYLCVYPFVRSYEWYLLPDEERRQLLAEHGRMARGYPDVRANTVASFALGDYEWILAFEADELHRIVDLMRHLRASGARRHVREEIPFYTGSRRWAEWPHSSPSSAACCGVRVISSPVGCRANGRRTPLREPRKWWVCW